MSADRERIFPRLGTRIHELLECLTREWAVTIEDGLVEILVQSQLASF